MPIYDPVEERMVVRVVYDGVAFAGKTTNLRQLCVLFASQKKNEVVTPAELRGRTLYFDWLQITAGVACGIPLLSQVLSIPGQGALAPRRRHILATADVVVFVCESDPAGIERAREGLALYEQLGRDIPIVIQANKQDRRGALTSAEVMRALGRTGPVVEAIASDGVGVVDTFVHAVRAVVKSLEARRDLNLDIRRADRADSLLARLEAEGLDPEWAAEMYLEEAQAALMFDEAEKAVANDDSLREAAAAALLEITNPKDAITIADADVAVDEAIPVLPSHAVPTGFIWPAHTGRAVLRALELPQRTDAKFDADGTLTHAVDGHIVRTSIRAAFPDAESARQALVRTARAFTQIGDLLVPDSVLVAQQTDEGACFIWTVRPNMVPIQGVAPYVAAVGAAIAVSLRHGISLQLTPDAFGLEHGRPRYIGELSPEPPTAEAISAELAKAARTTPDPRAFYAALEAELQRRLTSDERAALSELGG